MHTNFVISLLTNIAIHLIGGKFVEIARFSIQLLKK